MGRGIETMNPRCIASPRTYRRPCSIGNCDEETSDTSSYVSLSLFLRMRRRFSRNRPMVTAFLLLCYESVSLLSSPSSFHICRSQIARRIDYPRLQSWPCTFTRCTRATRTNKRFLGRAAIIKMHQLFCTQREWLIRPCIFLSEISSFIREWNLDSSHTYREMIRIKNARFVKWMSR